MIEKGSEEFFYFVVKTSLINSEGFRECGGVQLGEVFSDALAVVLVFLIGVNPRLTLIMKTTYHTKRRLKHMQRH